METYNGYTNYETWAVALWMDNEAHSHAYWRESAQKAREEARDCDQVASRIWTVEEAERFLLADWIKEEITEGSPEMEPSVYSDLLEAAFGEVNWSEIAGNLLEEIEDDERPEDNEPESVIIFQYTRAQAIADGVLIDVTETAKEAGFKLPVAVTAAVWAQYVAVPTECEGQDEQGRLWDILWMLRHAISTDSRRNTDQLNYQVLVNNDGRKPQPVTLKSICGPGDDAEPVITIMLPQED